MPVTRGVQLPLSEIVALAIRPLYTSLRAVCTIARIAAPYALENSFCLHELAWLGRPAPPGGPVTAQGHPRRTFQTAIERGNLVLAEATARELGRITLEEALALTAVVAEKEPERRSRFAVRWLRRLLEEDQSLTIEEAAMAASCLSAFGGPSHEEAYGMLLAMAERATRHRQGPAG